MQDYQNLKNKLDRAYDATENFIVDYTVKMEYPVQFLNSVLASLETSEGIEASRANLEILQVTLNEMNLVLNRLMKNLEKEETLCRSADSIDPTFEPPIVVISLNESAG
jgi:hypothetical protein